MNQELLNQLKKDPETLKQAALEAGILTDKEAEKLFSPLDIDDLSSTSDIAKQFNERLSGIQKWVTQQIESKTTQVKKEVAETAQASETKKIVDFAKSHPELKKDSEVAAMMEQLYKTNTDLEDIYKKACVVNGLKPIAINKEGKTVNLSTGKIVDEKGNEVKSKAKEEDTSDFISSLKSDELEADTDDVDTGELKKDKSVKNLSVRDIAETNWNKSLADAGITDIPE